MSHLSTIKVGIRSKEVLLRTIERLSLNYTQTGEKITVIPAVFRKISYSTQVVFLWDNETQEYNVILDAWALAKAANFSMTQFRLEYTKELVQHCANSMQLNVGKWSEEGDNLCVSLSSINGATLNLKLNELDVTQIALSVQGMQGQTCSSFSAPLEQLLGQVTGVEHTAEFYAGMQEMNSIQANWQ
jgi:hypothetical protein